MTRKSILVSCLFFLFLISWQLGRQSYLFGMSARPAKKILIRRLNNGHYQLLINNKPFIIKGVCYNPVPIGKGYDYDLSLDQDQPWKIDAELMHGAGINVIRLYQPGTDVENTKKIIDYFYSNFGIRTILGHWLGFWEYSCSGYGDSEFRERVKNEVIKMVKDFKDEPGLLIWVLGNENNYSFGPQNLNPWTTPELEGIPDPYQKRIKQARIYYSFVNEVAGQIKNIDRIHPVAFGNGGVGGLETAAEVCHNIDLLGISSYSGKSFGSLFRQIDTIWNGPFFFTEIGSDSFDAKENQPSEPIQAKFIESQWKEIERNLYGNSGLGNCLGGCVFEWTDEWWKHEHYNPYGWCRQDTEASWSNGAYYFDIGAAQNLNMNEEWWGIVKLEATDTPGLDKRVPKQAYFSLKELWTK